MTPRLPRLSVVKLLIAKNIATHRRDAITLLCGELITEPRMSQGGPLLPSLWSPRSFFAFVIQVHRKEGRPCGA